MLARIPIQKELIQRLKATDFPTVKHVDDLPELVVDENEEYVTVKAASVVCNETAAFFEEDPRWKREGIKLRKSGWRFGMEISFDAEASIDEFEEAYCIAPLIIPAKNPDPAIIVRLAQSVYQHSTTQGGNGSRALLTFIAEITRR